MSTSLRLILSWLLVVAGFFALIWFFVTYW
jgi:hypothetical protein